jgi:hypothetical protein
MDTQFPRILDPVYGDMRQMPASRDAYDLAVRMSIVRRAPDQK